MLVKITGSPSADPPGPLEHLLDLDTWPLLATLFPNSVIIILFAVAIEYSLCYYVMNLNSSINRNEDKGKDRNYLIQIAYCNVLSPLTFCTYPTLPTTMLEHNTCQTAIKRLEEAVSRLTQSHITLAQTQANLTQT